MDKLLSLQNKIVPETIPLLVSRYQILRAIYFLQPVGRRALADQLRFQERRIRNEIEFLREQNLILATNSGMQTTQIGEILLKDLEEYISDIQGLPLLEEQIAQKFSVARVKVVPGDADFEESTKKDLARVTAEYLQSHLFEGSILAVTGGTTLAEVAEALTRPGIKHEITVIPARGGLGEVVEIQANTVAAKIAKALGGTYRLLHVPDDLRPETMQSILGEPKVQEILEQLKKVDMVLHGIGSAAEMAARRGMSESQIMELQKKGAVGETFGYYFAIDGSVIHSTSSIGLQLSDLPTIKQVVAVAGGRSKGVAVKAVLSNAPRNILIIDEGAARAIVE